VADDPILSLSELRVEFPTPEGGWRAVVDGVSLEVAAGERVALVGESGSGKSATALAALGLVMPPGRIRSGRITVAGTDLATASHAQLRHVRGGEIGLIFQEVSAALNPVLTAGNQIAETVRAHREATALEARAVARQMLDELGLEKPSEILAAAPHQLSGGQLQRVMIAIALAGEPRLLIADEPTTALDPKTQTQILDLLRHVTACGTALLLISHDLAVVAELVDRIAVIHDGRIVESAPTNELFSNPQHPQTQRLVDALQVRGRVKSNG
jgi:ABC-type dipeptide/oligopeptide/nickel transport system ATPase component